MPSRSSREKIQTEAGLLQDRRRDFLWLGLLVLVVASFWGLTWNAQPYLSSDDMGMDLYPFEMTLRGQWPCHDYYWQYGPLMPFYYAFWLSIGGVHLVSIRMGCAVVYLLASILSYRILRLLVSSPIAFLASLSFLIQGMVYPYYNFTLVGAVPFLLASLFCLWKYFLTGHVRWGYAGTLALIGTALVKWNIGVSSFFAFLASLILYRPPLRKKHLILLILIFISTVLGSYALQYQGVPASWVVQLLGLNSPKNLTTNPWINFKHLIQWFLVWDRSRLGWVALGAVFGVLGFLGWRKRSWESGQEKVFRSAILSLFLFGIFNSSDFFALGHIYRLDFWSFPILVLLMGLLSGQASFLFGQKMKVFLAALIFAGVIALPLQSAGEAFRARVPERYLDFPRGRVYLVKETLSTIEVFKKGTRFILENTKPDEEILTLPKDPLYCFLSGRRHAVRELDFEQSHPIPEAEEEVLIRELKTKEVPFMILTNRDGSNSTSTLKGDRMGFFGKTHLRKLGEYLFEHYEEVQTLGPWEARNPRIDHAIKILRKTS